MPLRPKGRMTARIIPQRVPPSASAPSHCSRGHWAITSRDTDVTIGRIMMPTTMPATKLDCASVASGWKG